MYMFYETTERKSYGRIMRSNRREGWKKNKINYWIMFFNIIYIQIVDLVRKYFKIYYNETLTKQVCYTDI